MYGNRRIFLIRSLLLALVVMVALLPSPQRTLAQGTTLSYGQSVVGEITAASPFVTYSFSGTEGDVITAYAVAIEPDMALSLNLLGSQQEPLAFNENDPLGGGEGSEVRLSYRLPATGQYTLLVAETGGPMGQFLLRLNGRSAADGQIMQSDAPVIASLPPGQPPQAFVFDAVPTAPVTLVVSVVEPVDVDFTYDVMVYDGAGQLMAFFSGNTVPVAALTLPLGDTFYEVLVSNTSPSSEGAVSLLISEGAPQQPSGVQVQPTAAATQAPSASATPSVCMATSGTQANVRRGPSTVYDIVGALTNGASAPVVGRSADGTWLVVDLNGRQGWISSSVVRTSGPCAGLSVFAAPPTPTPIATATPLPTATPATSISFTADRYTINLGECANLSWNVQGVSAVYYQGQGVGGSGTRSECPAFTTTYNLTVTLTNGQTTTQTVTITVVGGYRISFTTTANAVTTGQCVTLSWSVEGVSAVYYQGAGVAGSGSQQECPAATTTYVLRVITNNNQTIDTPITVTVNP